MCIAAEIALKILHINFSGFGAGAGGATAMYWLQSGLSKLGHQSRTLFHLGGGSEFDTDCLPEHTRLERGIRKLTRRLGLGDVHRRQTFQIPELDVFRWADVVNLHVIHSGFFNYRALPKLTSLKPTVFTVHDMWPVTGNEYYDDAWDSYCSAAASRATPLPPKPSPSWSWRLKQQAWQNSRMKFVSPSHWLTQVLLGGLPAPYFRNEFDVTHVPNGLDLDVLRPTDLASRTDLRKRLGIPTDRAAVLVSSANLSDPRKGMDLLVEAMARLPEAVRQNVTLMCMGAGAEQLPALLGMPVLSFGYVTSEQQKSNVYNAADLFVLPTRADNQPCTVLESLACGTPVVSFDVGGLAEVVVPGQTGVCSRREDPDDFASCMTNLLSDPQLLQSLRASCRAFVEERHSNLLQARSYVDVYRAAINGRLH